MARGPNGEWRPQGAGPCAIHVMKILTGRIPKDYEPPPREADPRPPARGHRLADTPAPSARR